MPALIVAGVVAAGAQIAGGIIGANAAAEESERAMGLLNDAVRRIDALKIPDITKRIIYQQYMQSGSLTPETLTSVIEEHAPVALLTENPAMRQKQEQAVSEFEKISKTGLGAPDKLALEKARRSAAQDAMARMATIESQAKQRGQFGGGAQLAMQMKAAQDADDRQAMENLQIAANAAQNRQNALANLMSGAGQIRQQDLAVEESNVQAKRLRDQQIMQNAVARAQWNAQNRQNVNQLNLQRQQQIADANTQQYNQEQYRRGYLAPMQQYQMEMQKQQAIANLYGQKAGVHMLQGQNKAQMWNQIGRGVASGAMDIGGGIAGGAGGGMTPQALQQQAYLNYMSQPNNFNQSSIPLESYYDTGGNMGFPDNVG